MSKELLADVTITGDSTLFNLAPVKQWNVKTGKPHRHGVVLLADSYVVEHYLSGGGTPVTNIQYLVIDETGTGWSYYSEAKLREQWRPVKILSVQKLLKNKDESKLVLSSL